MCHVCYYCLLQEDVCFMFVVVLYKDFFLSFAMFSQIYSLIMYFLVSTGKTFLHRNTQLKSTFICPLSKRISCSSISASTKKICDTLPDKENVCEDISGRREITDENYNNASMGSEGKVRILSLSDVFNLYNRQATEEAPGNAKLNDSDSEQNMNTHIASHLESNSSSSHVNSSSGPCSTSEKIIQKLKFKKKNVSSSKWKVVKTNEQASNLMRKKAEAFDKKIKYVIKELVDEGSYNPKFVETVLPGRNRLKGEFEKAFSYSTQSETQIDDQHKTGSVINSAKIHINPLGIQMISSNLYKQMFDYSEKQKKYNCQFTESLDQNDEKLALSIEHLKKHDLWGKNNSRNADVPLQLPNLLGDNLNEHFRIIADKQAKPYKILLEDLVKNGLPPQPKKYAFTEGWTKYFSDGTFTSVKVPECNSFVFDVEVCVQDGDHPILATAASNKHWYSWCSQHVVQGTSPQRRGNSCGEKTHSSSEGAVFDRDFQYDVRDLSSPRTHSNEMKLDDLIPFGTDSVPKIIVGHNVSYDRIRIKEQYYISDYPLRFIDTMSLHIAVSGLVQEQRSMVMKNSTAAKKVFLPWMSVGSLNNLNEVSKLYCNSKGLEKQTRDVFVKGSIKDIQNDFQNLMAYCAKDVQATHEVLINLLPLFYQRIPHPVSFAGMLEMGSSYLPVNQNWNKYIKRAEEQYFLMQSALTEKLSQRAVEALQLQSGKLYERDPWLWDLDWGVSKNLLRKGKTTPNWYVKLCKKTGEREGTPEPANMSTSLRIVPKLLRLTWKGYPLHHLKDYGWGYLRPKYSSYEHFCTVSDDSILFQEQVQEGEVFNPVFPIEEFYKICPQKEINSECVSEQFPETQEDWEQLLYGSRSTGKVRDNSSKDAHESKFKDNPEDVPVSIYIPGVEFIRLLHKNGINNNVGNPLAKDFLHKIEDGTLSSHLQEVAAVVLKTTKSIAYWRNARDRILSQNTVWLDGDHLPDHSVKSAEYSSDNQCGAILPQVVACGTVTRRAVERTWLTASNACIDRIGSELKALVTAPPGYHFVGADVDSQELWIAALLGDSYFAGIHGCTALSWMTLQGSKAEGTDLHSKTAQTANITRDQAKVINYGRIYGAGMRFLQTLLRQYNSSLTQAEARRRAETLLRATKGERGWRLSEEGRSIVEEGLGITVDERRAYTKKELNSLSRKLACHHPPAPPLLSTPPTLWTGGSESHTFNYLEELVRQDLPCSPVLGAAIPRPLQPHYVGTQHTTSRMNWVVQSSAVDYLHLMTVCMRWLAEQYGIDMRFSISIHDEVRYLVQSPDRYRAALALQITNLLTRALFADRVGMPDLPLSVAFFSSVDIDKVLRKDPHDACVTPSNSKGLKETYGVEDGTSLTIYQLLQLIRTLDEPNTEQTEH